MNTFTPKAHIRGPIMPIQILNSCGLSLGAKILYNALIHFAGEKDYCKVAHLTLANFICCSVSYIKNYMNELKIVNLIRVEKRGFGTSIFYFLRPSWASDSNDGSGTQTQGKSSYGKPKIGAEYNNEPSCEPDSSYIFTSGKPDSAYDVNCKNLKPIPPLSPECNVSIGGSSSFNSVKLEVTNNTNWKGRRVNCHRNAKLTARGREEMVRVCRQNLLPLRAPTMAWAHAPSENGSIAMQWVVSRSLQVVRRKPGPVGCRGKIKIIQEI